ncbi:uncharacterized protein M421DRAFT_415711 [Didymella exigua CBS 183.55]|uniref:Uncharacterized protein n=1 Tax=Didymella exigua CBS 183.55 TaxID=1150837 RepID=A0A6A5RY00_9PLEO|nr:uncharacterized protein M421DRAFT_415711 [Didymella exigua CBS 183.55]KAF1933375.1 hypothetical protein M421DRAFT_415711 [Didymella exigua CBS 183.55]
MYASLSHHTSLRFPYRTDFCGLRIQVPLRHLCSSYTASQTFVSSRKAGSSVAASALSAAALLLCFQLPVDAPANVTRKCHLSSSPLAAHADSSFPDDMMIDNSNAPLTAIPRDVER